MRPFRSFILLLLLLAALVSLRYIIPSGYIELPSVEAFIPAAAKQQDQNVPPPQKTGTDTSISVVAEDTVSLSQSPDTLPGTIPEKEGLGPWLDSLHLSGEQIRIMYYGDSQLEGDRITSFLREYLRRKYGGTGPGIFLPVMPVMYTKSINIQSSSSWKRYNFLSYSKGEIPDPVLGPLMSVCRYLPPGKVSPKPEKATVKILPSVFGDTAVLVYEKLRILYRGGSYPTAIGVKSGEESIANDTLPAGSELAEYSCYTGRSGELEITFTGKTSPDIFAISVENDTGIVVDNIPQRGSAGLEFTMADRKNLEESYRLLDPDLVVIHFGLNVVRNVIDNYRFYEDGLASQIRLLKQICPEAKVLVVSLTDMAYMEGDSARSFSNIGKIREAQHRAAEREGALFFDSYRSMGGMGSIKKWAAAVNPLAQKDLVHFTYPGADSMAVMLLDTVFRVKLPVRTDSLVSPLFEKVKDENLSSKGDTVQNEKVQQSYFAGLLTDILSYNPDSPFIFTTPAFWLFFLIVLAGYSVVFKRTSLRTLYLLAVSLFFYFKAGGMFILMLFFVTLTDYTLGLLIHRAGSRAWSRFFLILSLFSNLLLLAYFKYAAFLTELINSVAGTEIQVVDWLSELSNLTLGTAFNTTDIILPVGISFFTFQSLSYTIDIFRKRMAPVKNILDFGFYVSFFPHLVAGPIVRASVFIPQIHAPYSLSKREFSHAVFMIVKGLAKKMIISNFIALNLVDRVFDAPAMYSGLENLMAVYGYSLQIYCDFSGYTDIAIGVALLMGFRLPINFNSPYKASEITDFWKRWHISLSQWLKDYLYIPLGGNRKGKFRTSINLLITMLLGGLWHGASLRFVLWGGLHGIALIVHKLWKSLTSGFRKNRLATFAGILVTFHFVTFTWIFFRADSMQDAGIILSQIAWNFDPGDIRLFLMAYSPVLTVMAAGFIMHYLPETVRESYRALFIKSPLVLQMAGLLIFGLFLWQLRGMEAMPFIYFRF